MIFGRGELERRLNQEKTDLALRGVSARLDQLAERVESANHWKSEVVDRLDHRDRKSDETHAKVEQIAEILAEMQANTMTPEELAAVGARAKRDVFYHHRRGERRKEVDYVGSWGNALMPVVTVASIVVSIFLGLLATGHLH